MTWSYALPYFGCLLDASHAFTAAPELVGRHASVGEREDLHQAIVMLPFQEFREVARQGSLHHRVGGERGLRAGRGASVRRDEGELTNQRILRPERAVVVEDGKPFRHRHEVRTAFRRHAADEVENGSPGLAVVPRWKWVSAALFHCHLTELCQSFFDAVPKLPSWYTATLAGLNVKASNGAAFNCLTRASDATPEVT